MKSGSRPSEDPAPPQLIPLPPPWPIGRQQAVGKEWVGVQIIVESTPTPQGQWVPWLLAFRDTKIEMTNYKSTTPKRRVQNCNLVGYCSEYVQGLLFKVNSTAKQTKMKLGRSQHFPPLDMSPNNLTLDDANESLPQASPSLTYSTWIVTSFWMMSQSIRCTNAAHYVSMRWKLDMWGDQSCLRVEMKLQILWYLLVGRVIE